MSPLSHPLTLTRIGRRYEALRLKHMPEGWAYVEARQAAGDFIADPEGMARQWAGVLAQNEMLRPRTIEQRSAAA